MVAKKMFAIFFEPTQKKDIDKKQVLFFCIFLNLKKQRSNKISRKKN